MIDNDCAYFGTFDSVMLSLDLKRRKVPWRFVDPDRPFPFYSSPALIERRVIVCGRDKMIRALNWGKKSGSSFYAFG